MKFLTRVKILPLLVAVALLSFTIRLGDFVAGFSHSGTAFAQYEADEIEAPPPLPSPPAMSEKDGADEENRDETGDMSADETDEAGDDGMASMEEIKREDWTDSSESDFEYSQVREELYKDLVERREELTKQKKELAIKEALLKAAERELDQKLRELTTIRNEIQGLLNKQTEEERARIESLVKIYEGMKAKDAANIFNTLDIDVLVMVLTNMSERKAASVLAEMNPERARTVTILLAQQRQLPGSLP